MSPNTTPSAASASAGSRTRGLAVHACPEPLRRGARTQEIHRGGASTAAETVVAVQVAPRLASRR